MPAARYFSRAPRIALADTAIMGTLDAGGSSAPDSLRRFHAVEARHLDIHQHDIVMQRPHRLDGVESVVDDVDLW